MVARKVFLPQDVLGCLILFMILSTTYSQWISYKNSRNGKSNLWYPNMPATGRSLQQRSSSGHEMVRGSISDVPSLESSRRMSGSRNKLATNIRGAARGFAANNGPEVRQRNSLRDHNEYEQSPGGTIHYQSPRGRPKVTTGRSRQRSVGQPTYGTVHGGVISRQESLRVLPRQSNARHQNYHHTPSSQFSRRSGIPHSYGKGPSAAPTVVSSKQMTINLGPKTNTGPWSSQGMNRRFLEVGPATTRPVSQSAGALQDSWPNSNTHHHLSPVGPHHLQGSHLQRGPVRNYYDNTKDKTSPWGSHVRIADKAIHLKNSMTPNIKIEPPITFGSVNPPIERKLPVGREKLVKNTLNTLAKLSPKKPIYVYLRVEGIAAIKAGAEAGDVIKKLAGGSKLPFYNGTKSLPTEHMPQVFLAPNDMSAPKNYGKIPIPNLKQKEKPTPKPTFTKILLPGGTKMISHLSPHTTTTTTTTTTTPAPRPTVAIDPNNLSLEQKIKILQMFQKQVAAAAAGVGGPTPIANLKPAPTTHFLNFGPSPTATTQSQTTRFWTQSPTPTAAAVKPSQKPPSHADILRGVLPQGAILESITPLGGKPQGLNSLVSATAANPVSNSLEITKPPTIPPAGSVEKTDIKDLLGSIIESAVSKTVGDAGPVFHQNSAKPSVPARVGHPQGPSPSPSFPPVGPHSYVNKFPPTPPHQAPPHFKPPYPPRPHWSQPRMESGPTIFVNNNHHHHHVPGPVPSPAAPQSPPIAVSSQRQGVVPSPPPRPHPIQSALSFMGFHTTPTPPRGPPVRVTSPRPFPPTRLPAVTRPPTGSEPQRPGTIIVQTPDASKPAGQKSTFVISGPKSESTPDLNKIMKVLTEINGDHSKLPFKVTPAHGTNNQPKVQPLPTQRPVQFVSPRPQSMPIRVIQPNKPGPQVVIKHPSGTPLGVTPMGHNIVSPTSPRPMFVSSTPRPPIIVSPSPSSIPLQVMKAISGPQIQQKIQNPVPTYVPNVPQSGGIVRIIQNAVPNHIQNVKNTTLPNMAPGVKMNINPSQVTVPDGAQIIEVDPALSPEEIQKSIMESIKKHQLKKNGGITTGPIVINAHPSMASVLGNSPYFKKTSNETAVNVTQISPSSTPNSIHKRPSSVEIINASGSKEERPNSKIHHHSKEISDEKPTKVKNYSEKSQENQSRSTLKSSKGKVVEKVITEEKIIWNPGPRSGEMIPSKIKTEERIVLNTHDEVEPSNEAQRRNDDLSSGPRVKAVSSSEEDADISESMSTSKFADLLRSKLKFEKMKEKLHAKKQSLGVEKNNPFSKFLHPPTSTVVSTSATEAVSPDDISQSPNDNVPVLNVTESDVTVKSTIPTVQPTIQAFEASPSPSQLTIEVGSIPPGTKEEKLLFIPASDPVDPTPTIQTVNDKNQTVVFTTMNNLPDLMTQLSGKKTQLTMVNDMKTFQNALSKIQKTVTQPTPTSLPVANRRMDTFGYDTPFTWRPNGTIPSPTMEAIRRKFPNGVGANVLHAMSAGFSINQQNPAWTTNVANQMGQQKAVSGVNGQQQPIIYTVSGAGVQPVPINSYQPILIQGTKEPVLAYYGYNWNSGDAAKPLQAPPGAKYTSKFRPPIVNPTTDQTTTTTTTLDPLDPVSKELLKIQTTQKVSSVDEEHNEGNSSGGRIRKRPGVVLENSKPSQSKIQVSKEIFVNSGEHASNEAKPTVKLPILLAPSIISRKPSVSKTGPSLTPKPTATSITTTSTSGTTAKSSTTQVPTKASPTKKQSKDQDLLNTQEELRLLLKKLQQSLSRDDVYALSDGYYDYYDEVALPVSTSTTTTKRPKPKPKASKSKSKKSKSKKGKKSKKSKKSKKKSKGKKRKSSKNTHKKVDSITTTTTTTPSTTTKQATVVTSRTVPKHNRHPVSSIEQLSKPKSNEEPEPQQFQQTPEDISQSKDTLAARTHYRRPLWIRRQGAGGDGALQPVGKPSGDGSKVIRLVRRRRPIRRRPVFSFKTTENPMEGSSSSSSTEASSTPTPEDLLFKSDNNELSVSKRVGVPDSQSRSQGRPKKRRLKLVRVKGQRAQWKLKMNEDEEQSFPQAAKLVAPSSSEPQASREQLPTPQKLTSQPLSEDNSRQSRQTEARQLQVESKVCVRGKCKLVSAQ